MSIGRLLARRNRTTGVLASYLCQSPGAPMPLHALVTVADFRWSVEELWASP